MIMNNDKPLILITNDDGMIAKGISELVKFVRPLGEIVVVAPDAPRSGSSSAITVTTPVHFELVRKDVGLTVYRCSGYPVDCIKIARSAILDREPNLIISGINHGDNAGVNVHYSGTMGAVIEGCLNGIPSIGFSLCDHRMGADFEPMGHYVREISGMVLRTGLPHMTCLNVNFPNVPNIKGIKACSQGKATWSNEWEKCPRKHDENYYWMSGECIYEHEKNDGSDYQAMEEGYGAITPIKVDITDFEYLKKLEEMVASTFIINK